MIGTTGNDELSYTSYWPPITLAGGLGDDTYRIETIFEAISEAAGGGVDTAISTIMTYALPDEVENLIIAADRGFGLGNAVGNRITGSDAGQVLNGGGGDDLLTGGAGHDIFQILAGGGWDVITDFETGADRLHLAAFAGFDTAEAVLAGLRQYGANVLLDLGGGQGVTFLNHQVGDFAAADLMLAPGPAEMTLTFDEEFDSFTNSPDGSQGWRTTFAKDLRTLSSNQEQQYYTDASVGRHPFRIDDGALVVTAMLEENDLSLPYTSGLITTAGMFAQRYGYFEARMLLPAGLGFWPAFWLLPANGTWPPELDIMENFNRGDGTLNFGLHGSLGGQTGSYSLALPFDSLAASYHTFAASWLPDEIRYYVDGVEVASVPTLPGMTEPMYMLLNLAVNKAVVAGDAGAEMRIDYVRAYAYSEATIAAHPASPDRLTSEVSATLPDWIHDLVLTGTGPLTGTGNVLNNALFAGSGDSALYGLAGADLLTGGDGNDTLDGGTGADAMLGGAGNDTYSVDNTGDRITELADKGSDTVRSSITYTLSGNLENLMLTGSAQLAGGGNALDNQLTANDMGARLVSYGGNDTLTGGAGVDWLDGGTGADVMAGGAGNDTYVVDQVGDVVQELADNGIDGVQSALSYVLGANLEKLILTGTGDLPGTGNALDNYLFGTAGRNLLLGLEGNDALDGGVGADTMVGGIGNDTYTVNDIHDVIMEVAGEGTDSVRSTIGHTLGANLENLTLLGTAAIGGMGNALANRLTANAAGSRLYGLDGNDVLTGGAANDFLDGGTGADLMTGGAGDDIYVVDFATDRLVEAAGGGYDVVQASISYALGANFEKLVLIGTTALNGTGNELDNRMFGNADANRLEGLTGNDWLDGGAGADTLVGGSGDDAFIVDNAADQVIEPAGGGNDVVHASMTYVLGVNLEKLLLTGTLAINGTGNELDNRLFGNTGANRLEGLAGNDWIEGGAGNDTLAGGIGDDIFSFAPGCGVDVVSDFGNGHDRIKLAAFHAGPGGMLVTHTGFDTVLVFATGDAITLQGVAAITLQGDLITA